MKTSWFISCWPHPLVSVLVSVSWMILVQEFSAGQMLMALLLGWLIPKLVQRFIEPTPNIDWWAAIQLCGVVIFDIMMSNFRVAGQVLGHPEKLQPQWYRVPLESNHPQVNALLAMIITTTPGTVSAGIDFERGDILVHALHCLHPKADIQEIKSRYEAALMKIFRVTNRRTEEAT